MGDAIQNPFSRMAISTVVLEKEDISGGIYSARNKVQKLVSRFLRIWYFNMSLITVPLKMCRKYGQPNRILVGQMVKLVGKWPMADCYF